MSRTKSLLKEELDAIEELIAGYLETVCMIPGCKPILHKADADYIINLLRDKGYITKPKDGE